MKYPLLQAPRQLSFHLSVKVLAGVVVCLLFSLACQISAPGAITRSTESPTPSSTALPAVSTPTLAPSFTNTPEPTATRTSPPTATPLPPVLSVDTVKDLRLAAQWGSGAFVQMAWSPDGSRMAILTTTKLLLYNSEGKLVWDSPVARIQSGLAFSADGKSLITIAPDRAVLFWDLKSGKEVVQSIQAGYNTSNIAISADGLSLAVKESRKPVTFIDPMTGGAAGPSINPSLDYAVWQIDLSQDGTKFLVFGAPTEGPYQVQVWDRATGAYLMGMQEISYGLEDVSFSNDGLHVGGTGRDLVSQASGSVFYLWDTISGQVVRTHDLGAIITSYVILSDSYILSTNNSKAIIYDLPTGKELRALDDGDTIIAGMAVSADEKKLATFAYEGLMTVWDMQTNERIESEQAGEQESWLPYYSFTSALSQDGKRFAIGAGGGRYIRLINTATGNEEQIFTAGDQDVLYAPAFSPDGKLVAAARRNENQLYSSDTIIIWNAETGRKVRSFEAVHDGIIRQLKFTDDGAHIILLVNDAVYVHDAATGASISSYGGYSCFDLAPDGVTLVSDNVDYGLYFWDTSSGKLLASAQADYITHLAFSPLGSEIAVASIDIWQTPNENTNQIGFVSPSTYSYLAGELIGFKNDITSLAYSPDGKLLAVGEKFGTISIWDVESRSQITVLNWGTAQFPELFFSPDGRILYAAAKDGVLNLFEVIEWEIGSEQS